MSKLVFEEEGGVWWVRDLGVPGAYGTGSSRKAALADLAEAKAALSKYLRSLEDAADVRAADKAYAEILAGGRVYTHEEVVAQLGLGRKKRTRSKRKRR